MGHGRWDNNDWDSYTTKNTKGKSAREIFNSSAIHPDMDPRKIQLRESRNSADNPHSTPIILALDVTGSMGVIAERMAREGLGTLVEQILDRKPVSDPHIMVMGVGDAYCDRAPLQASQFEADIRIAEQLKNIYLEGGGGGNHFESYNLPWYFAAKKTEIDSVSQGRKGVIFTFGDEECPPELTKEHIKKLFGDDVPGNISSKDLLKMVSAKYDVFHVVVEQGNHARSHKKEVYDSWNKVLPPERIVSLKDYNKLSEVLVSVLEVHNGKDPAAVVASWQGETAKTVQDAIKNIKPAKAANSNAVPLPPSHLKLKLKP
ncbi:MAG: hypothetical protein PW788_03790 [Micavibrio sp.]|nr:hypothetical protein [Micavibrio sp.]